MFLEAPLGRDDHRPERVEDVVLRGAPDRAERPEAVEHPEPMKRRETVARGDRTVEGDRRDLVGREHPMLREQVAEVAVPIGEMGRETRHEIGGQPQPRPAGGPRRRKKRCRLIRSRRRRRPGDRPGHLWSPPASGRRDRPGRLKPSGVASGGSAGDLPPQDRRLLGSCLPADSPPVPPS